MSRALTEAMQTVQHTKHFAHPANWAGFMLVGADVRLSSKVALMGQALCELLKSPDKCRDALRVSLHLVRRKPYESRDGHLQELTVDFIEGRKVSAEDPPGAKECDVHHAKVDRE